MTISTTCDIVVLIDNSAVDIAAKLTLLLGLPVSNLTDFHSDYTSLIRIPALIHLQAACDRTNDECYKLVSTFSVCRLTCQFKIILKCFICYSLFHLSAVLADPKNIDFAYF